jgi:hypothetical protein
MQTGKGFSVSFSNLYNGQPMCTDKKYKRPDYNRT